jgi:hypothetical protein
MCGTGPSPAEASRTGAICLPETPLIRMGSHRSQARLEFEPGLRWPLEMYRHWAEALKMEACIRFHVSSAPQKR